MALCKVCGLKDSHPGVLLDADQTCNVCTLDVPAEFLHNLTAIRGAYEEFARSGPNPAGRYDCLLMFSGGKDSTYMLDKVVSEQGRRVLAYTFSPPYESRYATENIRLAQERIPATYVIDRDDGITKVMRHVFNRPPPSGPGRYLDEKLPCTSCRTFFVIRAILQANRLGVPYILLCADPQQMLTTESNPRRIVREFYRSFGRELTSELFGDELEALLFAEEDELPRIVFPYAAEAGQYDPARIVELLKKKGLYQSSPFETHCTLLPLLNYYSFKNWDCMFYKLNAASHVRAVARNGPHSRPTYSVTFPPDVDIVRVEERLRVITFEIAVGIGNPSAHEEALVDLFEQLGAATPAARHVAHGFLEMRSVADAMGLILT
jgi:hypothetical protein